MVLTHAEPIRPGAGKFIYRPCDLLPEHAVISAVGSYWGLSSQLFKTLVCAGFF